MCEYLFGQCASGLDFTTSECASTCLVNVRVVRFLQHQNVRVLVWSMCEWPGHNVRVNMECASTVIGYVRAVRS